MNESEIKVQIQKLDKRIKKLEKASKAEPSKTEE